MPVEHAPAGAPGGGRFVAGSGGKHPPAHHAKAPAAPPTFAELQQWEKDAQAGKKLTARQKAALHAAHEAHLAHVAHEQKLAADAKAAAKPPAAEPAAAPTAAAPPASGPASGHTAHVAAMKSTGDAGPGGDDEFTALYEADLPRVDLVGKGANGIPRFLIAKQDEASAGLLDPDFVRRLIAKSPEEAPVPATAETGETVLPNGIVIKGSPAAMAAFIHAASARKAGDAGTLDEWGFSGDPTHHAEDSRVAKALAEYEAVIKAKYNADDLKRMAANGQAMDDESYPIADEDDLGKAIHAVGRGGSEHDAIRRHVIARAKALGKSSMIPDNWLSDGSLKTVAKEAGVGNVAKDLMDSAGDATALDDGIDGLDPTVPLAAPDDDMDLCGDPADPGSPAWEAIDAATAQKWLSILSRASNALCLLAEREMLEAASADPSDAENVFDLEDAKCAIEYAISQLAVFAAGEQAQAEIGAEMAEMCKALAGLDTAPIAEIEGLTAVAKAGRVLSASNEAKLRSAAQAIGEVLSSLPQAPEGVAKSKEAPVAAVKTRAAQVAKETASPEAQARETGPVNAGGTTGLGEPRVTGPAAALPGDGPQAALPGDVPGRTVVKSAGLKVVVYDRAGNEHRVNAAQIFEPVTKADDGDAEKPKMQAVFDQDGDLIGVVDPDAITPVAGAAAPAAEPDAAPAPAADDMTPQPPADAGTPADAVGKAAEENVITLTQDVLKSIAEDAARTALEAREAAHAQVVAKMAADNAGLAGQLQEVTKRLAVVEEHPAAPGVFANGQRPPEGARPVPPRHQLRGQDQGAAPVDVAKARERKAELYAATGPDQARIAKEMNEDAAAAYAALRAGR